MGTELIIKTDLEHLPPIEFNYESLKEQLDVKLERYRNLVIEEKDIPDAKKDRAELNKLSEAIDNERKRVKKLYSRPIDAFEKKMKDLTAMIGQPVSEIDSKIKEYEARKKQEKRAAIERYYKDNVKDLADILTLDKIYNPKWENATVKPIDATQEMYDIFERLRSDLATIKSMNLPHETAVIAKLADNLNLGEALKENARLTAIEESAAKREAERKAEEERAAAREAQKQAETFEEVKETAETVEETKPEPEETSPVIEAPKVIAPTEEPLQQIDFRVWVTAEQKRKLAEFIKSNNIRYGKVPTEQREAV